MKRAIVLAALPVLLSGQVTEPRLGVTREPGGAVRIWTGAPGAFIPRQMISDSATAATGTSRHLAIAEPGALIVDDQRFDAPEGVPVLGISGGVVSAWYPSDRRMLRVEGGTLTTVPVGEMNGEIRAVSGDIVIVQRGNALYRIRIRPGDGAIEADERIADAGEGPVTVLPDQTVVSAGAMAAQAGEPVETLAAMGDSWINARTATRNLAVRCAGGKFDVFILPEVQP